jgi:hypothetical protein
MFGQYTLGWPLVLLGARRALGTATAALPLAAALCATGTYALALELLGRRRIAAVAGGLMVASPIFALQSGVFLTYVFTLGLGLLFSAALLSGLRLGSLWRPVLAGALLGWIFLTRPFDAVIWGATVGGYALWRERDRWRPTILRLVVAGAAALPFVVAGLLHNRRLTGDPLEFAVTVKDPLDTFGFGERRLMPGFKAVDYTVGSALRSAAKNAFFFPWFLAGTYVALGVAAASTWHRRHDRGTWLLLGLGLAFPLAYLPFWGTHLSSLASRISGPIYLVPLYAPVCILTAAALVRWWDERRRLAWVVAGLLVVATIPAAWDRFTLNRTISRSQAPWEQSLEGIEEPALVLVADSATVLYANPSGANRPELDGPRLFAVVEGPEVLDLIAEQPERAVYLQAATVPSQEIGPREDPTEPDVVVRSAQVLSGSSVSVRMELELPPATRRARLTVDTGAVQQGWTGDPGSLPTELTFGAGAGALPLDDQGRIDITLGWGEEGEPPTVRASLLYRVTGSGVEVLSLPLVQQLVAIDDGVVEWRHALSVPELAVTVARGA